MSSNLMKIVASSVSVANKAGDAIRAIMKSGNLAVVDKGEECGDFDPQTEADRTAQSIIVSSLTKQFPGLKIVGEEDDCGIISSDNVVDTIDDEVIKHDCPTDFKDLPVSDFVVWVDPLDGTKEFTEGHVEHVTVLIGISARGKAVAGIIHQPFYQNTVGRTMWGVLGLGAFGISRKHGAPNRRVITTTKSHMTQEVSDTITALKADEVLRTGGCGFKVLQVIEGTADAYVFATPGTKRWDSCAPEALLTAMGGTLNDICDEPIDYSKTEKKYFMNWTGLLATFGNHESFASKVPDRIKNLLKEKRDEKLN